MDIVWTLFGRSRSYMGHVCKEEGGIQITVSHISPISLGNQYQKYTTVEDVLVLKVVNVRKHH